MVLEFSLFLLAPRLLDLRMVSASFFNSIHSLALRQVARHWLAAGCGKRMPAWSDINPSEICAQLPIVWAYRFERETGAFIGRLAGDRITQIFGKSFRGLPLSEAHPPEAFPLIYQRCKRVVLEPAVNLTRGQIFKHLGRSGRGERVMLPLSSDGVHGDGILGATEYYLPGGGERPPAELHHTSDEWGTVEPALASPS